MKWQYETEVRYVLIKKELFVFIRNHSLEVQSIYFTSRYLSK